MPSREHPAASDCLYPLPDGRRCCECATCQGYELLPSEELILERREEQRRENEQDAAKPWRCRLGFHKLTTIYRRGWFDRVRCVRCNMTGWFPAKEET